ncbi:MAG: hypothetical protein Kow0022_01160 [Phycisphaerales bacterium]
MTDQDPNDAQESPDSQPEPAPSPESHEAEEALSAAENAVQRAAEASEEDEAAAPTPEEEAMLAAFRAAIDESEQVAASAASTGTGKTLGHASSVGGDVGSATPFDLPEVQPGERAKVPEEIQFLSDVNLNVRIELGRTRMYVEDVLRLGAGAVVELDKLAGDPVDVYVNNRLVARGEVLVLNDNFCVRVSEIVNIEDVPSAND